MPEDLLSKLQAENTKNVTKRTETRYQIPFLQDALRKKIQCPFGLFARDPHARVAWNRKTRA
jgi:hypothetical protein